MRYQWRVLVALSVAVLVGLVVATPATAQIHDMEKLLNAPKASMAASTQRTATVQCTPFCSECIYLDMYQATTPKDGNIIVHTQGTLAAGQTYVITIRGDYTVWQENGWWVAPGAGIIETAPEYPSPGTQNWDAFIDWEYLFGYYKPVSDSFPIEIVDNKGISLDGGVTYQYITPIGGHAYNANHFYQYRVTGQGHPAYFMRNDAPTYDNSGRLKICVQLVTVCGDIGD